MKEIHTKYEKMLELPKILKRLASYAVLEDAKKTALALKPCYHYEKVRRLLAETDGAYVLGKRFGLPPMTVLENPAADLLLTEQGGVLSPRRLLNIAKLIRQVLLIEKWYAQCSQVSVSVRFYFEKLVPVRELKQEIENCILNEEQIADHASHTLFSIRQEILRKANKIKESLQQLISGSQQKYLQESIITIRDGRYVVPVRSEYGDKVPGIVHDRSNTGSTLFIEPMHVIHLNNQMRVLENREKEEIERILQRLSAECANHAEELNTDYQVLTALDLLFAKVKMGQDMRAIIPKIADKGSLFLQDARHPLIDDDKVVPIKVKLGGAYQALIITGPNTGGKTVALKTIGLLTLMTMCGLMIPVSDGSRVLVFHKVLADIGDEQSIEQSLSTFSAHMTNLVTILQQTEENALILLDEIGAGTDPTEGAALAKAIIQNILNSGAKLAATTHYAELKIFALETQGVENASCAFDIQKLQPTYQLVIGQPGRSNAFSISKRLGLYDHILEEAKKGLSKDNKKFENVVRKLEKSRKEYENLKESLSEKEKEISRLQQETYRKRQEAEKQIKKMMSDAKEHSQYMVLQVREQANRLLNELKEMQKQKAGVKEADRHLSKGLHSLYAITDPVENAYVKEENYRLPRPLQKGDLVFLTDLQKKGTVLKVPNQENELTVQVGMMKMRTNIKHLRLLEKNESSPSLGEIKRPRPGKDEKISSQIDLRGKRVEEALIETEQFIDHCVLANLQQCMVIHGKGTGALRKAVHQLLAAHPNVKQYRIGNFGEGDTGVTVVEIR